MSFQTSFITWPLRSPRWAKADVLQRMTDRKAKRRICRSMIMEMNMNVCGCAPGLLSPDDRALGFVVNETSQPFFRTVSGYDDYHDPRGNTVAWSCLIAVDIASTIVSTFAPGLPSPSNLEYESDIAPNIPSHFSSIAFTRTRTAGSIHCRNRRRRW